MLRSVHGHVMEMLVWLGNGNENNLACISYQALIIRLSTINAYGIFYGHNLSVPISRTRINRKYGAVASTTEHVHNVIHIAFFQGYLPIQIDGSTVHVHVIMHLHVHVNY